MLYIYSSTDLHPELLGVTTAIYSWPVSSFMKGEFNRLAQGQLERGQHFSFPTQVLLTVLRSELTSLHFQRLKLLSSFYVLYTVKLKLNFLNHSCMTCFFFISFCQSTALT